MTAKFLHYLCMNSNINNIWRPFYICQRTNFYSSFNGNKIIQNAGYSNGNTNAKQLRYTFAVNNSLLPKKTFATQNTAVVKRQQHPTPTNVEDLLENLRLHYKQYGYLLYDILMKLLKKLESRPDTYNELLTKDQTVFLLAACGKLMPAQRPNERMGVFERLWSYLERNGQLTKEHYFIRLEVLQFNCWPLQDLHKFMNDIAACDADVLTSSELFDELLKTACACGDMRRLAADILKIMREKSFPLNERNFNALILGNGKCGDLESCKSILDSMLAAGVPITNETQVMLFLAYASNNQRTKLIEILKKFHRSFDADQILKMLRGASVNYDIETDLVKMLINELPKEYLAGPEVPSALRNICCELLHIGKLDIVVDIINTLPKPNIMENQDIDQYGVFLLSELFRVPNIEKSKIIEIAQVMKESGKNERAVHIATEIALRKSPSNALAFLETLAKDETLRPHYFWPLFMHNFRCSGESGIFATLKEMSEMNVECDNTTLSIYVLPHITIALEYPVQAVQMLKDSGVKPSLMLTTIIKHLLGQQIIEETRQIAEKYATKLDVSQLIPVLSRLSIQIRSSKRYQEYAQLLAALSNKKSEQKLDFIGYLLNNMLSTQPRLRDDLVVVQRFLYEMEKIGLKVSPTALKNIKSILDERNHEATKEDNSKALERINQSLHKMSDRSIFLSDDVIGNDSFTLSLGQSSPLTKHPRDMSLNELECHLIELESKNMNTRGILRRLLQICVRDNRLQRALEIKAKCDELKVHESPGMIASVLDMYIKLKNLAMAEKTLKYLQKQYPGFQIDEHKIIDYAALLVHHGNLDAAKQLLKHRADKQKIIGGEYVLKNIWNFLTNVAYLAAKTPNLAKDSNITRNAFIYLQQLGYTYPHNTVLGPIVREYLLRGDMPKAVEEFRQLSEKHKHTPLQFEILSLLVKLSNDDGSKLVQHYNISNEDAQKLLTEVTSIISNVHGIVNMHSALVLAFAESGTDNQLRRLLMNPDFRVNHNLLQKNMEHLGQEGAVTTLLRLARGSRGLSRSINEQLIYDMLLKNFIKANDHEAALNLYERLEADDELKMSQEFLRSLVNLLKINNIDVPSNIALRAQVI